MLFKRSKPRKWLRTTGGFTSRPRRLQIDILEERRLLAGMDVFVFEDLDASRSLNSENGIAGQVAFIDLNRDSRHTAGEPLAVTNRDGIASFSGIDPGVYSIRLLGSNKSIEQTTPVQPAPTGHWQDLAVSQFSSWSNEGELLWGVRGNELVAVRSTTGEHVESIVFDGAIRETVTLETEDGRLKGFAILDTNDGQSVASFESGIDSGFATSNPIEGATLTSLTKVGSRVIAWNSANKQFVELQTDSEGISLKPLEVPTHGRFIDLKPVSESRVAVLESVGNAQRLSIYDLTASGAEAVAHRFLINTVLNWKPSANGELIFIDQGAGVEVYEIGFGIPNILDLPGSKGPVLEDIHRGILYTGSAASQSTIEAWDVRTWKKSSSTPLEPELSIADLFLSQDAKELHAVYQNRLFTKELLVAAAVEAKVGTAQRMISFGLRPTGQNSAPRFDFGTNLTLDEDTIAALGANLLQSLTTDSDGDSIHWIVVSPPAKGTLEWSTEVGGTFKPTADASGTDSLWIAAFDGANWSDPIQIPIIVSPVNDLPTDIVLSRSQVDENIAPNHVVAIVSVVDPDQQDSYELTVSDSRFRFVDNQLVFADGVIDFEIDAFIPIFITAINRALPSERISHMVSLNVVDKNEPPRGILVGDLSVGELEPGGVLGDLGVNDPDALQLYDWTIDDTRFEVRNGKLVLKEGYQLDYETESSVSLLLKATDRNSGWTVEQTISVSVIDHNDPPIGIMAAAGYDVPENVSGSVAGYVYVEDADYGEEYLISVNDSRFEVVNNTLKLVDGTSLTWQEPGFIDVSLTAVSLRNGNVLTKSTRINIVKDETPYHNDHDPADVDGDGTITPIDALVIVNYINNHGPGVIKPEGEGPVPNLDVDGDGMVTPIDILIIINIINSSNNARDYITVDSENAPVNEGEGEQLGSVDPKASLATPEIAPDLDEPRRRRR